jgi:hypothetical protein
MRTTTTNEAARAGCGLRTARLCLSAGGGPAEEVEVTLLSTGQVMASPSGAQLVERAAYVRAQLERTAPESLTADGWAQLWSEEGALETELLGAVATLAGQGSLFEAVQIWETVADLNDELATIARALVEHPPAGDFDPEELAAQREGAAGLAIRARGQSRLTACTLQRLSGSPADAAASAEEARRLFESVSGTGTPEAEAATTLAMVAEGYRLGAVAGVEQFRFQYADAALTYLQAKDVLNQVRDRWLQEPDANQQELAALAADISAFETAHRQVLLLQAISDGNFDDAVEHATAMVEALDSIDVTGLPVFQRNMVEVVRSSQVGTLAYARAELAANTQDWEEAARQIALAAKEWLKTVGIALNSGLPQGRQLAETTQAQSAQVLGATRRRITREKALHATIASLEVEAAARQQEIYRLAARPTVTAEGGVKMSEQIGDITIGDKIGGDKVGGDKVGRDKITAGGNIDFSNLWQENAAQIDLAALAQELTKLLPQLESSDDGTHDAEIAAATAAQVAASAGDGPKALKWLKTAGKWVLDNADKIGAVVVSTALKVVLGV